jgi:hypothetical protein
MYFLSDSLSQWSIDINSRPHPSGELRWHSVNHAAAHQGAAPDTVKSEMEALVRAAGFRNAIHHPIDELNARYLAGRSDRLRLRTIERLLTAIC